MSSAKSEAALTVDATLIPIIIRRYAQSRGYRLRYDANNRRLLLSVPARGALKAAITWARTQEDWVRQQMIKAPEMVHLAPNVIFPIEGSPRQIYWAADKARRPILREDALHVGGPEAQVGARILRWLRTYALDVLTRETLLIASREDLRVTSVRIGDTRSRWGSCTSDGAIRYSWRLILAPPDVRLATVAHEVAHLLHMDHSPAFHAAHARLLGVDPKPARLWLKTHGAGLHRISA